MNNNNNLAAADDELFSGRTAWEKIEERILALQQLEPDEDGGSPPSLWMIATSIYLAKYLKENGWTAPDFVCVFPGGHVALEWHYDDGIVDQIEVQSIGIGERMKTYPDLTKDAEFSPVVWPVMERQLNYCTAIYLADCPEIGFNLAT